MKRFRLIIAGVFGLIAASFSVLIQGDADVLGKSNVIIYKWEWPAGRVPQAWIVVDAIKIKKKSSGIFGVGNSPSLTGNLPDAHRFEASITAGSGAGQTIEVYLPGLEAKRIAGADKLAIGLVEGSVVICLLDVPPDVSKETAIDWAARTGCPK